MKNLLFIIVFLLSTIVSAQQVTLLNFASGLSAVTDIKHAGDDRLFVVEQAGRIKILDLNGNINPVNFLNITNKLTSGGERGLLGLAFSPDYQNDGYFYVNYTNLSGNTVIARYSVDSINPDKADSLSEDILLTINQFATNHNGGHLVFGPDGYLYIGMGDGGGGGDPQDNGQNNGALLGKMLRIDVSGGGAYTVPADNPFVGVAGYLPEIWQTGLRNPWRYSFDRVTGDLWIADVGQGQWEEINFQPASSNGGENWGWRCYEGNVLHNGAGCLPQSNYDFPVHVYPHSGANSGCSVTGGYVYRGAEYPTLYGRYFYADYCSGLLGSINYDNNCSGNMSNTYYGNIANINPTTFGEDKYGNLYIGGASGQIKKIADTTACTPVAFISCEDSIVVCNSTFNLTTPIGNGFIYQWYLDGIAYPNTTNQLTATQTGTYSVVVVNAQFCTAQSADLFIEFASAPVVNFSGLQNSYCDNDSVSSLTGTPAGGIFSGPGITGNIFDPQLSGPGTHTIEYFYSDTITGCFGSAFENVTVTAVPQPVILQNNDTLFSNLTGTLQWLDSTMTPLQGATGNYFLPTYSGIYFLQFTDTNGCSKISNGFLFVDMSVNNLNALSEIEIFPNPADDYIVIKNSGWKQGNLFILNQLGSIVYCQILVDKEEKINLEKLNEGIYYLIISGDDKSTVRKLVLLDN